MCRSGRCLVWLLSFALGLASAPPALATPNMTLKDVYVTHDGRSLVMEAYASDPHVYGAVDWTEGWAAPDIAVLTVVRGTSTSTFQVIFTGASVKLTGGQLLWEICGLIPDAGDIVIPGDAVTFSNDAGWLQDSQGNSIKSNSGFEVTNYSLVGTDGFIDESQFSLSDTIYVDLEHGTDWTQPPYSYPESTAWGLAKAVDASGDPIHPLLHLSEAIVLWDDGHGSPPYAGNSCAIRVKRGTSGSDAQTNINYPGHSLFSPLLISAYGSGVRPHITYPGDTVASAGLVRPSRTLTGVSDGDYVYVNGLHLESTFSGDRINSTGIDLEDDMDHFVVSDCVVEGFSHNIDLLPAGSLTGGAYGNSHWFSLFRNIIIDSHSSDNPQGIGAANCQRGLVISQNVVDHNGWGYAHSDERLTTRHNIYVSGDPNGPYIWGNMISRGAAYGVKNLAGGVIYGNVFAENALGCEVSADGATASPKDGGGRIARNYFEHGEDLVSYDNSGTRTVDGRGWGPSAGQGGTPGYGFGPTIMELNCIVGGLATTDGTRPLGVLVQNRGALVHSGNFDENGDFTDWTPGGSPAPSIDTTDPFTPPSCAAFTSSSSSSISQTLNGVASGRAIHVEFWIKRDGSTVNSATVSIGSTTLLSLSNETGMTGWTLEQYDLNSPSSDPTLQFSFATNSGHWRLDEIVVVDQQALPIANPEVLVRNNTIRGNGPMAINVRGEIFPMVVASRNCCDARTHMTSHSDIAMWINNWAPSESLIGFNQNEYKCASVANTPILENTNSNNNTTISLSQWHTDSSQDGGSAAPSSSNPTYATGGSDPTYDLISYASHVGFDLSDPPALTDYYYPLRNRPLGDSAPALIDFVSAAAYMIGKYEVTSGDVLFSSGPDPLGFEGSGDGSDPQDP